MLAKQQYIVTRGDERYEGNAFEVAERVGCKAYMIYRRVNRRKLHGWTIERKGASRYGVMYLAVWDGGFTKKTFTGTASALARLTYMSDSNIRKLAESGKPSRDGWTVQRLTERTKA